MIIHKIQCSQFGRSTVFIQQTATAKQMRFPSGFKCAYCFSTSDLFWQLVPTAGGIIAKSGLPLFCVNPWYF